MRVLSLAASLAASASLALAATVYHDFSIEWVTANPDGAFERNLIGVNGQWPPPPIECNIHDRVIINVTNNLGNEPTSLHFHGIFQNGTTAMDGPVEVTQCPIPVGSSFVYNFTVDQPGTYWYHSHYTAQYPDGLRAPFIVHDPEDPQRGNYDEDLYLTVSDYYHDGAPWLTEHKFLTVINPTGSEPIPDAALINDTQNLKWSVRPNTTYKIRIVNVGALVSQYIWFEGHDFQIVEIDGVYVEPATASMLYITVAQRYTILLTTKNSTDTNFPMMASFDTDMLDTVPDTLNYNATGWLTYDESGDFPDAAVIYDFDFYDDFNLVPVERMEPWEPDYSITLTVVMQNLGDGVNYAFFNDLTYTAPKVPTLMTVMSSGNMSTDAAVYGTNTHTYVLEHNQVVEIVLNNADPGKHPFHLHGHVFQVIERSEAAPDDNTFLVYDADNPGTVNQYPMRRDTVYVRPQGYFVIRFRSDNPGVWFFHCHIEWHLEQGLALVLVEAPLLIQERQVIPEDHYAACRAGGYAYEGNAAANTVNLLDLTGEPLQQKPLPNGFTARGIVAMVFSCVSAFLGMGFIAYYGMSELKTTEREVAEIVGEPYDDSGESK
ncbi:Cupredoxin [Lipomyces arxii]|uniref:Cupredoxin n=1 Tax=Lipomyces arxii TaxID=56418 RepID=UPI0034CD95B3